MENGWRDCDRPIGRDCEGQFFVMRLLLGPERVFLQPERLNSPALRGFMRKVRWNDGLG
jgi:hypothetical protein